MSVSSISNTPPSPPPSYTDSSVSSSSRQASAQQTSGEFKPNKDGDEVAAALQASRPPLPPGQGARVDILV
jgi:hypothetical protein